MTAPELRPCPFCGAKLDKDHENKWLTHPETGCFLDKILFHEDELNEWNTRTALTIRRDDPVLRQVISQLTDLASIPDADITQGEFKRGWNSAISMVKVKASFAFAAMQELIGVTNGQTD